VKSFNIKPLRIALPIILAIAIVASFVMPVGAAVIPTVNTLGSSDIAVDYANIYGTIDDTGGEDCSLWGFEWGTTSGVYTDDFIVALGGYGIGTYGTGLFPLLPHTTYFYRFFAENSAGRGNGLEMSFTTLSLSILPSAPKASQFIVKPLGWFRTQVKWPSITGASEYMLRAQVNAYPTTTSSGYLVYQGTAIESTDFRGFNIRYTLFYKDGTGIWQTAYRGHAGSK
jgi:hypothetical protein